MQEIKISTKEKKVVEGFIEYIKSLQPLPFNNFFDAALLHPKYGYYNNIENIGSGGDFTTAPEVCSIFSEMLAMFCISNMSHNECSFGQICFVEYGAGTGNMALEIINTVERLKYSYKYYIIEKSNSLKIRQKSALSGKNVSWIDEIAEVENATNITVIGNEFLDALAIKKYQKQGDKWHEIGVMVNKSNELQLCFISSHHTQNVSAYLESFGYKDSDIKEGAILEVPVSGLQIMDQVAKKLSQTKGQVIMIDYGQMKHGDINFLSTVQAIYNKGRHNLLNFVPLCDITYLVTFEPYYPLFTKHKFSCFALQTMGQFLIDCGIKERVSQIIKNTKEKAQQQKIFNAVDRLLLPDQMGQTFKVFIAQRF